VTYFRPEKSSTYGEENPSHLRLFSDVWKSNDGFDWRMVTNFAPWGARRSFGYAEYNGYIWIFGGVDDESAQLYNDIWRSKDGVNWELVLKHAPWSPRAVTNMAPVFDGYMWIVGGDSLEAPANANWHKTRTSKGLNDVWRSRDGKNWELMLASVAPLPELVLLS